MTTSQWSEVVYGRTLRADFWWRAVPDGADRFGWLGEAVRLAVAGGAHLRQPRFLLGGDGDQLLCGVACRAGAVSDDMSSDGRRPLYGFVGWWAPAGAVPPSWEDMETHWQKWAIPVYERWVRLDWDRHPARLRNPHFTEPESAPWEPAVPGPDQPGAAAPEPPWLRPPAGQRSLLAPADVGQAWRLCPTAGQPFLLVAGWPERQQARRWLVTHLSAADIAESELVPAPAAAPGEAPGAAGDPSRATELPMHARGSFDKLFDRVRGAFGSGRELIGGWRHRGGRPAPEGPGSGAGSRGPNYDDLDRASGVPATGGPSTPAEPERAAHGTSTRDLTIPVRIPTEEMTMKEPTHPLTGAVVQSCTEAADLVARLGQRPAGDGVQSGGVLADGERVAAAIQAVAARVRAGAANLVVVGEKKRGKSSLINALVDHADLLPVDADVATSVHIGVGYAPEPYASVHLLDVEQPKQIGLTEIADYAAIDPSTQQPRQSGVAAVEVGVPSPLLNDGLALVDTPGVGGLVAGHTEITVATLARADALVFVVNGASELTESELRFLIRVTEQIDTVVFVLTQTDKYASWPQTLERNRALLREHSPRYQDAPWFAVSSRAKLDAEAARRAGDGALADSLLADSCFADLAAALRAVALRAEEIRLGNALHVAGSAVRLLAGEYDRRLRSLVHDPSLAAEVQAREKTLGELQREDAAWRKALARRMREVEDTLQLGFRRSLNDLRALHEEKINTASAQEISQFPEDLDAGVRGVWMQLEAATAAGLSRVDRELSQDFEAAGAGEFAATLTLPARIQQLPELVEQAHDGRGVFATLERFAPTAGVGLATFAAVGVITGGLLLPATAGIGVIAGLMARRRRREETIRARGDATRHLHRILHELQTEVPPALREQLAQANRDYGKAIEERLSQQRQRVRRELAEHKQTLATAQQQLAAQKEQVSAELAALNRVGGRVSELRGYLSGTEYQ